MSYPAYPAYKDSGVEWLGEIPAHWEMKQVRHLFVIHSGSTPRSGEADFWDGDIVWLTPHDLGKVVGRSIFDSSRKITQKGYQSCGTSLAPKNSIVLSTRAPIGHVAITGTEACVNQGCRILEPKSGLYTYWYYVTLAANAELQSRGLGSTFIELSISNLVAIRYPTPTLAEQRAIAAFLDAETAQIDTLIAKQERLIALLQEKRQALISHAVTRGLNPDAPMKESGVEWLGEVPKHWGVAAVWMLFRLGRGRVISNEEILDNPGPYPVYSSQTERDGVMGYLDTFDFEGDYITWTTDGANAGTVFYRSGRFNCTNVCGTLYPSRDDLYLPFFRHAINNATDRFVRQDINPKLMNNVMASIRVQIPPREEQISIMTFLDRETRQIDTLIEKSKAVIERLQERRTALISAAVTGKIDVRAVMN